MVVVVGIHVREDSFVPFVRAAEPLPGILRRRDPLPRTSLPGYLAELGLSLAQLATQPPLSAVTFDVSETLQPEYDTPLVLVRLEPRPTVGLEAHEPWFRDRARARVVSVKGGIGADGLVIRPLDEALLREIATTITPEDRVVITGVGAHVDDRQERAARDILTARSRPLSMVVSASYWSTSFLVRERTGAIDSLLLVAGESVSGTLESMLADVAPHARGYVMNNMGGKVPLSRLALRPVHSWASLPAARLVGAAAEAKVLSGPVAYRFDGTEYRGVFIEGVPRVDERLRTGERGLLASPSAGLTRIEPDAPAADAGIPEADEGLAAVGAAVAPFLELRQRIVHAASQDEMVKRVAAEETMAAARVVALGADPADVRIVQSTASTTTYSSPNLVSLLVYAAGSVIDSGVRDHAVVHSAA